MHALGVPTTRALSLVRSGTEAAQRAWYDEEASSSGGGRQLPSLDDPRLARFPPEMRVMLLARQIRARFSHTFP